MASDGRFCAEKYEMKTIFAIILALTCHFRLAGGAAAFRDSAFRASELGASSREDLHPFPDIAAGNLIPTDTFSLRRTSRYDSGSFIHKGQKVDLVPDEYKFLVKVDVPFGSLTSSVADTVRAGVAQTLGLPKENVRVNQVKAAERWMEMYIVYTALDLGQKLQVLVPASQVVKQMSVDELQARVAGVKILNIMEKKTITDEAVKQAVTDAQLWNIFQRQLWETWQLPFLIASTLIFLLLLVVVFLVLCFRHQFARKETEYEQKPVCVVPVVKPCIQDTNPVQPEGASAYLSEENLKVLKAEPIRIKAKGLLERRGSNASLTIDLNPSQESSFSYSSPSRESNSEEFLLSAGNRMTRKQLRFCLKDTKALQNEFWDIPMNYPEKVEIAGSGTKNRYKTIIPNEPTRVKLPESNADPLTTYINSNYIRGYDGEDKAYIAAQGPMAHTIDDFWQMVWQEKSPIIVMITKLKEKNKVKCEPYVPECRCTYGNIEVTVSKVTPKDGYTVRELFLRNGNQCHQVKHFWYTAWPDHKTPITPNQLIDMAVDVESHRCDNNGRLRGPVVVHCSAGIGRTGCFIAISICMHQLLEESMVDVLGTICAMRLDRGGMIQTAEQYEFVHRALVAFERSLPEVAGE